jgi:hypothetical protein
MTMSGRIFNYLVIVGAALFLGICVGYLSHAQIRGGKAPERQQPTSGITFRIAVPESRTLSGVQVNEIAGSLKPNWTTVDDNQVSVYDVLDEAARRGLIELPDGWNIASDQNEMISKSKVLASARGGKLTRA